MEALYVVGGHRIRSHWVFTLTTSSPEPYLSSLSNFKIPFASRVGGALCVESALVGDFEGESMTPLNLGGEKFYWYPIDSGVQGMP